MCFLLHLSKKKQIVRFELRLLENGINYEKRYVKSIMFLLITNIKVIELFNTGI